MTEGTIKIHLQAIYEKLGPRSMFGAHYQVCTTEELPHRLLALIKKLDQENPSH